MKVEALLGFGQRAGHVVSGDQACRHAALRGELRLLIVSRDAGAQTERRFRSLAARAGIPLVVWGEKAAIGLSTGNRQRAVAGVKDEQLSSSLLGLLQGDAGHDNR